MNINQLGALARAKQAHLLNGLDLNTTGIAIGAVPVQALSAGIRIAMHCKTEKFHAGELGKTMVGGVLRPSPLQLRRNETIASYAGKPVNMLAIDGRMVKQGPFKSCLFDIKTAIPLIVNNDDVGGERIEFVYFHAVNSLHNMQSVFDDGDVVVFRVEDGAVSVELDIPLIFDDSSPITDLNDPRVVKPVALTVPAAALLQLLADVTKTAE